MVCATDASFFLTSRSYVNARREGGGCRRTLQSGELNVGRYWILLEALGLRVIRKPYSDSVSICTAFRWFLTYFWYILTYIYIGVVKCIGIENLWYWYETTQCFWYFWYSTYTDSTRNGPCHNTLHGALWHWAVQLLVNISMELDRYTHLHRYTHLPNSLNAHYFRSSTLPTIEHCTQNICLSAFKHRTYCSLNFERWQFDSRQSWICIYKQAILIGSQNFAVTTKAHCCLFITHALGLFHSWFKCGI